MKYLLYDVFTDQPFGGNQLAVVPDAEGLSDLLMAQIAREFNLSETVFIHPPQNEGNFRLRIFTPEKELPMAGHPTIGAAAALDNLGLFPGTSLLFEEGVGLVAVHKEAGGRFIMHQPKPKFGPIFEEPDQIAPVVGLQTSDLRSQSEIQIVSCGLPYLFIPIATREALSRAVVRRDQYQALKASLNFGELYLWWEDRETGVFHTRMFAPSLGITEDPATGSAAGPFGCYLLRNGIRELQEGVLEVEVRQGEDMGRPSRIAVKVSYDQGGYTGVYVGGQAVSVGEGQLYLNKS